MDDRLRLVAELQNKASAELKRLSRDLGTLDVKPGMSKLDKWFGQFKTGAGEAGGSLGTLSGLMSSIGVGGFAAALSLGEMAKSFKELADSTTNMKELGRQSGLTIDQVNQLQYAASRLHVDPKAMTSAIASWSDKMFDFRRHTGELYTQLNNFAPEFEHKLDMAKPAEQFRLMLEYLSRIKDPALQKRWSELFFGNGDISQMFAKGTAGLDDALAEAAKNVAPVTAEMQKQADLLNQSIVDFNNSMQNFETDTGPFIFKQLRQTTDEFRAAFDEMNGVYKEATEHPDHAKQSISEGAEGIWDHFVNHWKGVIYGTGP